MIKTKKKLALRSQTVTVLSKADLGSAVGGRRSQCTYEQSGCINGGGGENYGDHSQTCD